MAERLAELWEAELAALRAEPEVELELKLASRKEKPKKGKGKRKNGKEKPANGKGKRNKGRQERTHSQELIKHILKMNGPVKRTFLKNPPRLLLSGSECSGLGGHEIAVDSVTHGQCVHVFGSESDLKLRQHLRSEYPNMDLASNCVSKPSSFVHVFSAGAPCPPWSCEGDKGGAKDARGLAQLEVVEKC